VEEKEENERRIRDGNAVRQMTNTDGWQVIKEAFERWRGIEVNKLVKETVDFEGFIERRTVVRAIDMLFGLVDTAIAEGEDALKKLREEQQNS